MSARVTTGPVHVELYVRSLGPGSTATRNRVVDRVAALDETPVVDTADVIVWGDSAPATAANARTPMGRYICHRITAFREWARRNDLELGPGLQYRSVDSSITGESFEELRLPSQLLAIFSNDSLVRVAPAGDANEHQSVRKCVTALESASIDLGSYVSVNSVYERTSGVRPTDWETTEFEMAENGPSGSSETRNESEWTPEEELKKEKPGDRRNERPM